MLLDVDRLPAPGEEVFSSARVELLGGSAVNTGVVLKRLGHEVTVLGAVGEDDAGTKALQLLSEVGLATDHVSRATEEPTAMNTVLVTPDGERTMVGARGANVTYSQPETWPDGLDWLHISGYAFREGRQRETAQEMLREAAEREIPASLDVPTGVGAEIRTAVGSSLGHFALVSGSSESMTELTGETEPTKTLIDAGVRLVAASSGAKPLILTRPGETISVTPPSVDPIDATGAGDALMAGLIAGTLAGLELGPTAVLASSAGAAATLAQGASQTLDDRPTWLDLLDECRWIDADPRWIESVRELAR